MRTLLFLFTSLLLTSCIIQFDYGDHYEDARNAGQLERYVEPFDASVLLSYFEGNYSHPDSFSMMEVNAQQLKTACAGRDVWIEIVVPSCPAMYTDCGIVKNANTLADTSNIPVLVVAMSYQAPLVKDIQDSLTFESPMLVIDNAT